MTAWTVYSHAGGYAVGSWTVSKEGRAEWDHEMQFAMTIERARELVPSGLYRLERIEGDDPALVEIWI